MNRSDLLALDLSGTRRAWSERPTELRASSDGNSLIFDGYASVVDNSYPVFGGPPYGWNETVVPGAFKRTLQNNADVAFLVNHEGLTLARTKSGTLSLSEDPTGLRAVAHLDPNSNAVNDLRSAIQRGDVDEMSFGFRVTKDDWFDEEGRTSNRETGTERRITEINLNHGDVSAVNYGANPNTFGGFRGLDVALAELRAGHGLDRGQVALVEAVTRGLMLSDGGAVPGLPSMEELNASLDKAEGAVGELRAHFLAMANGEGPDGTNSSPNSKPASSPGSVDTGVPISPQKNAARADKYNTAELQALQKQGKTFPGGTSFPIADVEDLGNAIKAVGMGNADHDAIRRYIIKRADALNSSHMIPDTWASDGTIKAANMIALGPSTETLAALRYLHEMRRNPVAV